MSIDWRASLVPAAAVIPAPIAYIKVVAVKKLVVGFWHHAELSADWFVRFGGCSPSGGSFPSSLKGWMVPGLLL